MTVVPALRRIALLCSCLSLACGGDDEQSDTTSGSESTSTETSGTETETSGTETETSGTETETGEPCTPTQAVTLERLLARAELPLPLTPEGMADLVVTMPSSVGSDEQIYLLHDGFLSDLTFTTQFMFLVLDLSEVCGFNLSIDMFELEPLADTVVDLTSGEPVELELATPGGDGLNVWDVSALELQDEDCGSSVKNSISYNPDLSPYRALWNYTNVDDEVRSLRIYAGRVSEVCLP